VFEDLQHNFLQAGYQMPGSRWYNFSRQIVVVGHAAQTQLLSFQ